MGKKKRSANGRFVVDPTAKKNKAKIVMPSANPLYAQAMQSLRASSAAEPHKDRRTRRARTRSDVLRRELREQ